LITKYKGHALYRLITLNILGNKLVGDMIGTL